MCHGPTSNLNYLSDLADFGGHPKDTTPASGDPDEPASGYYALIDVEKLCGQADYTGLDVKGGVSLYAFFRGLLGSTDYGITAAYFHVNYMQHVVLSAAGVQVEE